MRRIYTYLARSPKARKILSYVKANPWLCAADIDRGAGTVGAIDYLSTLKEDNLVVFRIRNTSPFHPQGIKHWSAA